MENKEKVKTAGKIKECKNRFNQTEAAYGYLNSAATCLKRGWSDIIFDEKEDLTNGIPLNLYKMFGKQCLDFGKWLVNFNEKEISVNYLLKIQALLIESLKFLSVDKISDKYSLKIDYLYFVMKNINVKILKLQDIKFKNVLVPRKKKNN